VPGVFPAAWQGHTVVCIHTYVSGRIGHVEPAKPARCHRTIEANIRSHLYGGPQGWNPHFLRT